MFSLTSMYPFSTSISISGVALVVLASLLTAVLAQTLFNRYLHPLRHIPGPFWASLSKWWWISISIEGKQHMEHVACHEKYGSIVRVAPNYIMLNDPDYINQFYKWDRAEYTLAFQTHPDVVGLAISRDMKDHTKQRMKLATGFSFSAALQSEYLIDEHVNTWLSQLRKYSETRTPFDFAAWAQWLAMDVVMDVVFGSPLNFVEEGKDVGNLLSSIRKLFVAGTILGNLPGLVKIFHLPFIWPLVAPKDSALSVIVRAGNEAVSKRLHDGNVEKRNDVLQHWIEYRDKDGKPISEDQLKLEALGPIVAGSDTTSTATRAIVLYVSSNMRVYKRLMAEFTSAKITQHPIKYSEASKLPYLQAIISEALRVYHPVGTPMPRAVPPGGVEILGHHIPAGTWCYMPQWCLGRSKAIWGLDADEFKPERWLQQEGESEEEFTARLLQWDKIDSGFGKGGVSCLGKSIALMEINKSIFELFWNFDIEIVNPERPWITKNVMIFVHDEYMVRLTPRGEA